MPTLRTLELRLAEPCSARCSDGESAELTAGEARVLLAFLAGEPRGASRERDECDQVRSGNAGRCAWPHARLVSRSATPV